MALNGCLFDSLNGVSASFMIRAGEKSGDSAYGSPQESIRADEKSGDSAYGSLQDDLAATPSAYAARMKVCFAPIKDYSNEQLSENARMCAYNSKARGAAVLNSSLTAEERSENARKAVQARWANR